MTNYTREARRSARIRISLARIDIRHIDLEFRMAKGSRNHHEDDARVEILISQMKFILVSRRHKQLQGAGLWRVK